MRINPRIEDKPQGNGLVYFRSLLRAKQVGWKQFPLGTETVSLSLTAVTLLLTAIPGIEEEIDTLVK